MATFKSSGTDKDVKIQPTGTGKVVVGTGAAAATVASDGDNDLVLQTGNATTGSITITDGANGDISLTPNGTGSVAISKADIDGGTIDGTTIGGTTPAAVTTSSLVATTADIDGGTIDGATIGGSSPGAVTTSSLVATTADIDGGTIDGMTIGATTPSTGSFTQVNSDTIKPTTTDGSLTLQGDSSGAGVTGITIDSSGNATLSGNLVIPDNGTIGSASDTDAITIDSSGNFLVGTTTPVLSGKISVYKSNGTCATLRSDDSTVSPILSMWGSQTTGNQIFIRFATDSNAQRGTISYNRTSGLVAYNTTSDYRAKKDVEQIVGATNRLMQLNPVTFSWNDNEARIDGFLAHEAQEVVPEAVTGDKDAMRMEEYEITPAVLDNDGNIIEEAVMGTREVPDYQGIDQSKLVPLLTAALQEAVSKIELLEQRISVLETAKA